MQCVHEIIDSTILWGSRLRSRGLTDCPVTLSRSRLVTDGMVSIEHSRHAWAAPWLPVRVELDSARSSGRKPTGKPAPRRSYTVRPTG